MRYTDQFDSDLTDTEEDGDVIGSLVVGDFGNWDLLGLTDLNVVDNNLVIQISRITTACSLPSKKYIYIFFIGYWLIIDFKSSILNNEKLIIVFN